MLYAVDSNVLIYFFDSRRPWHAQSVQLLKLAEQGQVKLTCSELVFGELLAYAGMSEEAAQSVKGKLESLPISYAPITKRQIVQATELCRRSSLRLLDAMHVASGLSQGCSSFVTNDQGILNKKVSGISLIDLDHALST